MRKVAILLVCLMSAVITMAQGSQGSNHKKTRVRKYNPTMESLKDLANGSGRESATAEDYARDAGCYDQTKVSPTYEETERHPMGNGNSIVTYAKVGSIKSNKDTKRDDTDAVKIETSTTPVANTQTKPSAEPEKPQLEGKEFIIRNHLKSDVVIHYYKKGILCDQTLMPWKVGDESPKIILEENQELWAETSAYSKEKKEYVRLEPTILRTNWKIDIGSPQDPDLPKK